MVDYLEEIKSVVFYIENTMKERFQVLSNVDIEQFHIGDKYPDLILLDKESRKPRFAIEVSKNGQISSSLEKWKNISIPATLYLIVPKQDLENAKNISSVIGVNTRFGYYTIHEDKIDVVYE